MSISKAQFCTNLIPEFFKPSGPLSSKTQITLDINRPLIDATIVSNYNVQDKGKVEIELKGLELLEGNNLFRQDCFDFDCFQNEGVYTYIQNISDICIVDLPGQVPKLLTKKQRDQISATCYIDTLGNNTFFVRGTPDVNNYVYVADIGIINTTSGNLFLLDKNVSFYKAGKKNSLFALSNKKIPKGVKVAIIKRISKTNIEYVGTVYGQLENEFYFPHSTLKANRGFNTADQSISVENLSLNLLLLANFKQYEILENQIVYRSNNYSSPLIETTIQKSTNILTQLINTIDVQQEGSLPATIASYSIHEDQYNSAANDTYLHKIKECFDSECFDSTCFEKIINNILLDRSIDNRAIAWLIQYLVSFSVNYSVDITYSITLLSNYLLTQKNKTNRLYYKGWLSNSTLTQYTQSLSLNSEILSSTNISVFFALLKTFEITQDFNYLNEAEELYVAIKKYLINTEGLLKHSYLQNATSIESATYNLLFILSLEEYDNVLILIEFFKQKLARLPQIINEEVFVNTANVTVGLENVEITSLLTFGNNEFKLFIDTPLDNISTLEDIFKYNYLIYSNLILLNEKIYIPYLSQIEEKYNTIYQNIENDREGATLIFCLSYLINNKSLLDFNNSRLNSVTDLNNYKFQKDFIFNNLLLSTPKDYGWFNPNIITKTSHLGNIYYGIAKALAYNATKYEFNKKLLSIDNMYGILLNQKAEDYSLTRFPKENDADFKTRIKSELFTRGINKEVIESKLTLFNSTATIKDNVNAVLAYEADTNYFYNSNWGVGYIQGNNSFNTNITTFNFLQPVEEDVYLEIQKLKPAGIQINISESLLFNIKKSSTLINIFEEEPFSNICPQLTLENTDNITTENSSLVCTEGIVI